MKSAGLRIARPLSAVALLLATVVAVVVPAPSGAVAAGLVAAVLAVMVASTVGSALLVRVGRRVGVHARAALHRLDPHPAQSDPDARGHARPRAPGVLPTAA